MLRKKVSRNKKLAQVSPEAALLYTWCIPHLDIEGRIYGDAETLKGMVVPHLQYMTLERIDKCKHELAEIAKQDPLIILYGNDGEYIEFPGFKEHQKLNPQREAKSEIPAPGEYKNKKSNPKPKPQTTRTMKYPFEKIWNLYPKKVGRVEAERHFNNSVRTEEDWSNILKAQQNYILSQRVAKGYTQDGSTWFQEKNWKSWIDYKETLCPKCKGKGKFTSETGFEVVCDCPAGVRHGTK